MVVGQLEEAVDLVVVGAGPGGYAAALRGAQLGRKVTLVDRDGADGVGGVCLRVGCIPSKTLIESADIAQKVRDADKFGISASLDKVDMGRFQTFKKEVVDGLTDGVRMLLRAAKVDIIEGTFRFNGASKGVVTPKEGQARFLNFKDLVIATGSRPVELPHIPFDGDAVIDSTGALALQSLPKTMAIVGAGYIGLELGIAFAKLGVKVTMVEAEKRILPTMDAALSRPVAKTLKTLGVELHLSTKAQGYADGALSISNGGGDKKVAAEKVIVAVGRKPNTDDIGLADAQIETDNHGLIAVADDRRITPHIAAIGDITAGPALAHKATAEAIVAAEALSGKKTAFLAQVIPAVVFSDPEIASVGLTDEQAKSEGIEPHVANFPLTASGRAKTLGVRDGHLQIVADGADDRVIGVHVVGPHASDLIGEGVLAIEMGATVEDIALTVHAHPTFGELYGEAAHLAMGQPIHIMARGKK